MKDQFLHFFKRYELHLSICFFLAGILFDIFTLGSPDDPFVLIQQFFYLSTLSFLFYLEILSFEKIPHKIINHPWWKFHDLFVHFLYGSLLSVFTLLYLKSSSFWNSAFFLILLFLLLVVNEIPRFQRLGPWTRALLLFLCWFSFFLILSPIIIGSIGIMSYILSSFLTLMIFLLILKSLRTHISNVSLKKQIVIPSSVTFILISFLYFFHIIPPAPLHVEQMGIFHEFEKKDGLYIGTNYSLNCDGWNFFSRDSFHFKNGQDTYFVFSLFAPARLDDQVYVRWLMYEAGDWKTADRIAVPIKGGRQLGYRGFTKKRNLIPGDWQTRIETDDGRVIGLFKFSVKLDNYCLGEQMIFR